MKPEKHRKMLSNLELDIVKNGFSWLSSRQIEPVKELASTVTAHALWGGLKNPYVTRLILKKECDSWDSSIRDTARACSAFRLKGSYSGHRRSGFFPEKKEARGTKMSTILLIALEPLLIWRFLTLKAVTGCMKITVPHGNRQAQHPLLSQPLKTGETDRKQGL